MAVASDIEQQISKFEFQGVHFGDFPSVDMICVRGLCPVGEVGVGISTNSSVPPAYNQRIAITHYHGVKISTPEFSYFDDKMFMVKFSIECKRRGVDECIEAVKSGLDIEYGLTPIVDNSRENFSEPKTVTEFLTDAGSLVAIIRHKQESGQLFPTVRVIDRTLMDRLRKSYNPDSVPPKLETVSSQPPTTSKKADN